MQDANPYEAPRAEVDELEELPRKQFLADRGARFWAALIDGFLSMPGWAALTMALEWVLPEEGSTWSLLEDWGWATLAVTAAVGTIVLALQLYLLQSNGWTIGKRLLRIRIVRTDGTRASLSRIFWLRMVSVGILGSIPRVGSMLSLVDVLFIFRVDRRCLHDLIADTKVVNARPPPIRARRRGDLAAVRSASAGVRGR